MSLDSIRQRAVATRPEAAKAADKLAKVMNDSLVKTEAPQTCCEAIANIVKYILGL